MGGLRPHSDPSGTIQMCGCEGRLRTPGAHTSPHLLSPPHAMRDVRWPSSLCYYLAVDRGEEDVVVRIDHVLAAGTKRPRPECSAKHSIRPDLISARQHSTGLIVSAHDPPPTHRETASMVRICDAPAPLLLTHM